MRVWAVCGINASVRALSWRLQYESMGSMRYKCKCEGSFLETAV